MKKTISSFAILMAVIFLASCGGKKFHVNGNITEAKDSMLYFENMSLDGPVAIDSVKLSADGSFSFSDDAPTAPEFYRLRIANQIINLSVDSTETITVKASYPKMSTGYTVSGSEECATIKDLAIKQINLQSFVIGIENNPAIGYDAAEDTIRKVIEQYKDFINRNYIQDYLTYMERAGMIAQLRDAVGGIRGLGKTEKVYLDNTNLIYVLAPKRADIGNVRETFFMNQMRVVGDVTCSPVSDFMMDGMTFEIGGRKKGQKQISEVKDGYVVKDDIETGYANVIPLWAFGLMY